MLNLIQGYYRLPVIFKVILEMNPNYIPNGHDVAFACSRKGVLYKGTALLIRKQCEIHKSDTMTVELWETEPVTAILTSNNIYPETYSKKHSNIA